MGRASTGGGAEPRRGRRHAPDYFARLAGGTGLVIDCRQAGRIKPADAAAFAATERACAEIGRRYELAHEPDPVRTANLRWPAGYRLVDAGREATFSAAGQSGPPAAGSHRA